MNITLNKHEYLFVENNQLVKRHVGFFGRVFMWLQSRLQLSSCSMVKVYEYVLKNQATLFPNEQTLNREEKIKLINFFLKFEKFNKNHSKFINNFETNSPLLKECITKAKHIFHDLFFEKIEDSFLYSFFDDDFIRFKLLWINISDKLKKKNFKNCLFQSIGNGSKDIVEYLHNQKKEILFFDNRCQTPLMMAKKTYRHRRMWRLKKSEKIRNITNRIEQNGQEIIKILEERENDFTKDLYFCRQFGHAFSLRGKHFEGEFIQGGHFSSLKECLMEFSESSTLFKQHINEILNILECADENDTEKIYELAKNQISLVYAGWSNHSISLILNKNICVKIDGSTKKAIQFFFIDREEAIKDVIIKLIENQEVLVEKKDGFEYLHNGLNEQLNLKLFATLDIKQDGEICSWFSLIMSILIFLILKNCQEWNQEQINAAFSKVKDEFDKFIDFDRIKKLKLALPLLKKYPKIFNTQKIYKQLIEKCKSEKNMKLLQEIEQIYKK